MRCTAPGAKLSIITSDHAISRFATLIPSPCFMSRARPRLEVLKSPKNCERFQPGTLSLKGGPPRSTSGRFSDSTRTTVAPWSARYFDEIGPTPTHAKSATLMPAKGSSSSVAG